MYAGLSLDNTLAEAKQSVLEHDRMDYAPYFIAVEKYMAEHGMILGGKTSIDLLLGVPLNKDSFYYEIYSRHVDEHTKNLTKLLAKIHKTVIVYRDTEIIDHEYVISVNLRRLFYFYSLDNKADYDLKTMIAPRPVRGYFCVHDILCMNPKVHLMHIYRSLYRPYPSAGAYQTYPELLTMLAQLQEKAAIGLHDIVSPELIESIVAGDDDMADEPLGGAFPIRWKHENIERILRALSTDREIIFIGDIVIGGNPNARPQILTSEPIDGLVRRLCSVLAKETPTICLTYKYQNTFLPNDFQLVKYTLYLADADVEKISIMDVFNSPAYELIAVRRDRIHLPDGKTILATIGNEYVLLRFKLIDLWIMQLIHMHKEQIRDFSRKRIENILSQISTLDKQAKDKINTNPISMFSPRPDDYSGVYTDEYVAKKKFLSRGRHELRYYFTDTK